MATPGSHLERGAASAGSPSGGPPILHGSNGEAKRNGTDSPAGVPSPAAAGVSRPRRALSIPPKQRDHILPWLTVLACLLLAAAPLLIELGRPDVVDRNEALTLATSVQTWRDARALRGDDGSLVPPTPRFNGEPMVQRPPGVTWLHLIAFSTLDRADAPLESLILRGRLVSVAFALLAIAAVFWAGMSIGGLTTAALSALVCAALPLVVHEGRMATPAMPQLGAAMLCVAAALWAARPLKPAPALLRQASGWTIAGVALGATVLIGGIEIVAKVLVPLAIVLAICPRRLSYFFGIVAVVSIAALMVTPWALHVHEQDPTAWRSWLGRVTPALWTRPAELVDVVGHRVVWMLLATLPWTVWLLGGLIQPLSTSSKGVRQRMFMGWVWFLGVVLLLVLLPPQRGSAELLLALPAAALLVAQVFRQYTDLSDEGRHARYWRLVRYPYIAVLLALSIALPLAMAWQHELHADGYLPRLVVPPMNWLYWAGLAAVLLGIVGLSIRFAVQHFPARALVCWAIWVIVACGVMSIPLARGPLYASAIKTDAQLLAQIVRDTPVAYLRPIDRPAGAPEASPDPGLLLYAGVTIPTLTPEQARQVAEEGELFYLLTPEATPPGPIWREVQVLESGEALWHTLEGRSFAQPDGSPHTASR